VGAAGRGAVVGDVGRAGERVVGRAGEVLRGAVRFGERASAAAGAAMEGGRSAAEAGAEVLRGLSAWLEDARGRASVESAGGAAVKGRGGEASGVERAEGVEDARDASDGVSARAAVEESEAEAVGGGGGGSDDREAVGRSVVEVSWEEVGRPLESGGGLRLLTVRPEFSLYTRVRSRLVDPRVELRFDRDGRVESVEWVRRTGSQWADSDIETALYRWRASGGEEGVEAEGGGGSGLPAVVELTLRL